MSRSLVWFLMVANAVFEDRTQAAGLPVISAFKRSAEAQYLDEPAQNYGEASDVLYRGDVQGPYNVEEIIPVPILGTQPGPYYRNSDEYAEQDDYEERPQRIIHSSDVGYEGQPESSNQVYPIGGQDHADYQPSSLQVQVRPYGEPTSEYEPGLDHPVPSIADEYTTDPNYQPVRYDSQPDQYRQHDEGYSNDYGTDRYGQPQYRYAYRVVASSPYGQQYGEEGEDGYRQQNRGTEEAEYGQVEAREGDYTNGNYYVDLPDGNRLRVDYYVDGYSGYVAKVSYERRQGIAGYGSTALENHVRAENQPDNEVTDGGPAAPYEAENENKGSESGE